MNSITATTGIRKFDLAAYAAGRDLLIELAPTPSQEAAALRAAKQAAKHRLEMKAIEYADILMQKKIDEALDPATDPRLRRDLRNDILNRGIGRVPEAPREDGDKTPAQTAGELFAEMIGAMSAKVGAEERAQRLGHTRSESVERDVTPRLEGGDIEGEVLPASDQHYFDANQLLDDIEGEQP